ncbi:Transient receptor potential channel pyrexia [Chionoecetes opilio]|uniref:Transient receptor potential channel pyrexia n=1 Tax=Chionoecetes opilio TaxID=41210 RepID=A0A8J4YF27_CHIOP|nr:Transient receptor potential channel pyrexia [Chionoecetes opilio]
MMWPLSGKKCSLECFRGDAEDFPTEMTCLPAPPPPVAAVQGWSAGSDGPALSRMASSAIDGTDRHRETMPVLFVAIQSGDVRGVEDALKQDPEAALGTRYGGSLALHAACHARHVSILTTLMKAGAKVEALDGLGQTTLHLAVADGWHDGVEELLQHGASPNTLCEPPPGVKGLRIETPLHVAVRRGDHLSTVLLLQQHPDITQRDNDLCSVLHLAAHSRSLEITRQLLKDKQAKEVITSRESKGNSVLHMTLMTECDAACEATVLDLVTEFVQAGADINHVNLRGENALFLAAHHRLPRVVETLIGLGADPTIITRNGQSLLHAACHQGCSTSLGHILNTDQVQNLVTARDNEDYAPFHYAVRGGSIDCCELLLTNGDHLTRLDKDGQTRCSIILRHLPSAAQLLTRLFDSHVRLSNVPHHDPDFRVTFNYSVVYLEEEGVQSSLISELSTPRLEALLKHPLLESFLYFKWNKIKPFFYCSVAFYLMFLLLHSTFIVMTFGKHPWLWDKHPNSYTVFLILYNTMFLLILIPDLVFMFVNLKKFLHQWETYTKTIALASSAFVVFSCLPFYKKVDSLSIQYQSMNTSGENTSQTASAEEGPDTLVRQAAAVSAFFSWVEFMMLLGRFPSLGSYVLMFTRVARSVIKFLAAFSSLIIGFAISFLVLFGDKTEFSTLPLSLIKTLMMMIGEIDFGNYVDDLDLLGGLFFAMFLFLVCVLMANLLIGLAVNDIPDLQRQGKIRRLSKQASYLVAYERLMVVARVLRCFPRQLRILMTRRSRIPKSVDVFPNKNRSTTVSHRSDQWSVPNETLQEAILLGTEDSKIEFDPIEEEETLAIQFRSFKIKYDRDRRHLQHRLGQLPDTTTTETMLKGRLDHIQKVMQDQLLKLSLQLQKHHYLCSQCRQPLPEAHTLQRAPQTLQWLPSIPDNSNEVNMNPATHSVHPSQPAVMSWSPGQAAVQQSVSLPTTLTTPETNRENATVQSTSQQYPPVYRRRQ